MSKIFGNPKLKLAVFVLAGALAGYGYYYYVGCYSGTCPITSNPWASIAYGSLAGLILGFPDKKKKKKENAEDIETN